MSYNIQTGYVSTDGQFSPLKSALLSTFGELDFPVGDDGFINDHVSRAINRLIYQFREQPLIVNYLKPLLYQVQKLENCLLDFYKIRNINKQVGDQLNIIGEINYTPRNGLPDDEYRELIKKNIANKFGSGTLQDFYNAILLFASPVKMKISYAGNAQIKLLLVLDSQPSINLKNNLLEVLMAGVGLEIDYVINDFVFGFVGENQPTDPMIRGFGEGNADDNLTSGKLAERI